MIPEASHRPGLHPSIVLSAYVEPLVRGRRVAILGDSSIGLADELSQRGARLVHVYDPDTARTAEALARAAPGRPHQVAYAVLAGDLGVRDGAFDVVVVPDLAIFTDPAETMRRARRLCSQAGVAVFVTPNGGAGGKRLLAGGRGEPKPAAPGGTTLGYYELYDLVSLQFAKVRMIGQAPFVGYTVADFSPRGEPEVSVDTSLLATSEEPEHFIALGSDRPVSLDAYAVIELPWHDVADALAPSEAAASARSSERLALAEAEARVALLSAEIEKMRDRAAEEAREAASRAPVTAALSTRVAELEAEIVTRDGKLREVEARAGDNHVRAERLTNQIRDLDEELRRQRDRGTKLSKLLDDEKKGRTKAEVELGMLRGAPAAPGTKERIDALSAELAAAHARIGDLELEIVETRRRPAPEPAPAAPDPALSARVAELEHALSAAQHEAAAQRAAAADISAKADAARGRAAVLEGALETERKEKNDLLLRSRAHATEVADLERRLGAERERAGASAKVAADGVRRLGEAQKEAAELAGQAAKAATKLADAEKRAAELDASLAKLAGAEKRAVELDASLAKLAGAEKRAKELAAQVAELEAKLAAQDRQAEEIGRAQAAEVERQSGEDRAAAEAAQAEVVALEAALRARGQAIAALTRDLRESERLGRELIGELEAARATNGAGSADDLRGRLDALAQSAARGEADLTAATWRIAQLERELAGAHRAQSQPSRAQAELEEALAAARDEVAALRKALGRNAS